MQNRLTPEQRRRLEDLEARREAERLAELARQRDMLAQRDQDDYVTRRMERELAAIEAEREAYQQEERDLTGGRPFNVYAFLLGGTALAGALLGLIWLLGGP